MRNAKYLSFYNRSGSSSSTLDTGGDGCGAAGPGGCGISDEVACGLALLLYFFVFFVPGRGIYFVPDAKLIERMLVDSDTLPEQEDGRLKNDERLRTS